MLLASRQIAAGRAVTCPGPVKEAIGPAWVFLSRPGPVGSFRVARENEKISRKLVFFLGGIFRKRNELFLAFSQGIPVEISVLYFQSAHLLKRYGWNPP
jgi:hypothetical protein